MATSQADHTIAFAGAAGANADLACRQAAPYLQTLPCADFEAVFEAVASGKAAKGMLPIENSQAGRVAEIHALLPKTDLHIVAEHFQPIQHVLAAPADALLQGITTIYSHPQALMQCREHLKRLGSSVTQQSYGNTATAARDVAQWGDTKKAAICSPLAAQLYELTVLDEHFEDSAANTTVFVIIAKEPVTESLEASQPSLTSVLFELRNIPAALYKVLGGFATNGINMQKLESYIPGGLSSKAQFFITFEGAACDENVVRALDELAFYCENWRVLGSYAASPNRQKG